ncbi:MAG: MATE family efflux transporter [Oscillibacter sp.]|nr:MATE family efflux transporter [Oscillibacter sp.]
MEKTVPQENKMGTMPVGKLLFTMGLPMMASMLFQALYNVVDSIFVSYLGQDALNAVSLALPLQNVMIAVGGGLGVGMNALLSRSLGEKKFENADRAANTTIFLAVLASLVFALVGIFVSRPFFALQTTNENIIRYGVDYTSICLGLSMGIFLQFTAERMLQATGRTLLSMCTQVLGALINMVLDPILIFGLFGFPRLEVAGAAVATVAGQIVAAATGLVLNVRLNHDVHLSIKRVRWHGWTVKEIFRVGFPSMLMMSVGSVTTFTMNKILLGFSEAATAVYGAYFKLQNFIFMPVFGMNNACVPIVSYNYGAARLDRLKKAVKYTVCTAICIMTCGTLLFELAPHILLGFFNPSEEMLSIGMVALRIVGIHFPLAGFCIIAGSVCQAIGNPVHSLLISVGRQIVVLLPVAYLMSLTGNLNLVWLAFPIAEGMSLILSSFFLSKTMKKARARMEAQQ